MAYIGQEPKIEFSSVPTKDSFTGDGSTVAFDLSAAVATGAENALEVFVDNVRQEPGSGKAYTLGLDGSNDNKRITFTAAPANGAAIYVINDKSNTTTLVTPTNLGGVELILDADSDTSITADTDDQIDIKIAAADHLQIKSSSGDTVLKPMVDAKDIIFQQFDGNKIFCIDDGNFVSVGGNSAAPGEIRIYEDTDLGANYTGFKAGNLTASVAYQLPLADGSSGQALATDGSGVLSWTTIATNTPTSADGQALGSASLEWSDLFLADGAVINLGADQDVTLTHVADTGVLLNGASVIQFRDSGLTIGSNADGDLDIVSDGTAVDSINIESAGGITLDAGTAGSGVIYEDDGTEMMRIHNSSSDVIIETKVSDKDFIIKGNDGGSVITPFTLDMSAGGDLFLTGGLIDLKNDGSAVSQIKFYCESSNAHAQTLIGAPHSESASNTLTLPSSGGDAKLVSVSSTATLTNKTLTTPVIAEIDSGSTITLDATTDIVLDADGGDIFFKDAGTTFGSATNTSGNLIIKSGTTTAATFSGANVTFAGTIGSGAITSTGIVTGTGFTAGNAVLAEAELELLDGLTAGTAIASKVVTTDANIDSTGMRNLTISGEIDAATGDFSSDVDVAGNTTTVAITASGLVTANADMLIGGATPTLTIGDAGAEDTKIVFDGNAVDFVVGLDDSADEFRIGVGSALGSDRVMEINSSGVTTFQKAVIFAGSTPTVTVGDGGAEDAKIIFDGNAQNFHIGLDDSTDDLVIGLGNALGTTPALTIDENTNITIPDSSLTIAGTGNYALLTLKSTDNDTAEGPFLNFVRDPSDVANGDLDGTIKFTADNNAGEAIVYNELQSSLGNVADGSEGGRLTLYQMIAGTSRNIFDISQGNVIFNQDSIDGDFRVESNGNTHMLFVDGGNNEVGINTSTCDSTFHVISTGTNAAAKFETNSANNAMVILNNTRSDDGSEISLRFDRADTIQGAIGTNAQGLSFWTNSSLAERMRINSDGQVGIGTTSPDIKFHVAAAVNGQIFKFNNTRTSGGTAGGLVQYSYAPDDSSNHFFYCTDTVANRLFIHSNGNVVNHDNSYGQISDERIKQNITDANSQWNDIKSIKVRNFERKDDVVQYGVGEKVQIGVVAQEVETVSPGLIKEGEPMAEDIKMSSEFGTLYTSDDAETKDGDDAVLYVAEDEQVINGEYEVGDVKIPATHSKKVGDIKSLTGEKVKTVAYSVLYMKAIKALQEAMAKIETLETKVKALEDA